MLFACFRYRENMKQFVELSIDWPRSGIEDVVWWTEYVLRHKNTEHLKGPSRKISKYQCLMIDVIAGLLLIAIILLYLVIKVLKLVRKLFVYLFIKIINKPHRD